MPNKCFKYGRRDYNSMPIYNSSPIETVVVALEVIKGKYGNGEDRIIRLARAGYCPCEIQTIVNILVEFFHKRYYF